MKNKKDSTSEGLQLNEVKPTPTPWNICKFGDENDLVIIGPSGDERIATMEGNQDQETNAAFIVKAVNSYGPMVEALKASLDYLNMRAANMDMSIEGKNKLAQDILKALHEGE